MAEASRFALRAATFDELLGENFHPANGTCASTVETRLAAWCRASAADDWVLFERRLARDGWNVAEVCARFSGVRPGTEVPVWVRDIEWIRTAFCQRDPDGPDQDLPFGHLFQPVVDAADSHLPYPDCLAESARNDLRHQLLDALTRLCAPALFGQFRMSDQDYSTFVSTIDLDRFFDEKPVLIRLVAVLARQWINTSNAFCTRIAADIHAVRQLVDASPTSQVVSVKDGLSDRHRGGFSVLELTFDDGTKALYKPKDQRIDAAWHSVVDWVNNQDAPVELRAVRVATRPGYGWSEYIPHMECDDQTDVALYFRRAGALLALLHCLAASDVHHENIIAWGDQPVPVDLEALLQETRPFVDEITPYSAHDAARQLINDSVLSVGLLPGFARSPVGEPAPVGGLANGWSPGGRQLLWNHINSRAMYPEVEKRAPAISNLPRLRGRSCALDENVEEFIEGFLDYRAFLSTLDWEEPLSYFTDVKVRKIQRPTQFYHLLLERITDDRTMGDGVVWSVQADFMARLADWKVDEDPTWKIQRQERAALLALDIPYFDIGAAGGLRRARDRISSLNSEETAWQCDLIRQTSSFVATNRSDVTVDLQGTGNRFSASELALEADAVVARIEEFAIKRGSAAAWLGLNWLPDSETAHPAVLGHDLYSGNCGIALFLAAHWRVRQCANSAELARAALAAVRSDIDNGGAAQMSRLLGVGGATGLGSVVYALTTVGVLLADEAIHVDAERAAQLITQQLIQADHRFDIVGGCAGAILGLLRLHRQSPSSSTLEQAVLCGEHVLANRPAGSGNLAGLSHGAVGFAYSLGMLAAAANDPRFAAEARRWLAVERQLRISVTDAQPQWCHGAAGVAMAMLELAKAGICDDVTADDIAEMIVIAKHAWPDKVDTLCCGTLGNINLLLAAGRRDDALERLSRVLATGESGGGYRWSGGSDRFNVGLFRGLAGVGYTCLRLLDETLPNILVWQ